MRRSSALLSATAALLLLAGCSGTPAATPTSSPSASASVAPDDCAPENLTTRSGGTLTIAVPTRVSPPYFITDDPTKPEGDPASGEGFEAALMRELASRLGFGAGQITWLDYSNDYASSLDDVDAAVGRLRIASVPDVEFTTPYLSTGAAVVARTSGAGATTTSEVLARGIGTVGDESTLALLTAVGVPTDRVVKYRTLDSAMSALDRGRVSALVLDDASAAYAAANVTDASVIGTWGKDRIDIGLALRAGDPLLQCLDQALAAMDADGTLAKLASAWLPPVNAPVLAKDSSQ